MHTQPSNPATEGEAAIHAAGLAVNKLNPTGEAEIRQAVALARSAALAVKNRSESTGWQIGEFTGLPIALFQNWLYEKNRRWRFTDGTLCVLWCIEFPHSRSDYAKNHGYIRSTRRDYNNGKHQAPAPPEPCVGYDSRGEPVASAPSQRASAIRSRVQSPPSDGGESDSGPSPGRSLPVPPALAVQKGSPAIGLGESPSGPRREGRITTDVVDLVLLGALWGAAFLFTRIAVPEFGPVPLILVRVGVAAIVLVVLLAAQGGMRSLAGRTRPLVVLGAMNTAVPFSLFAFATLTLPAGLSSVLNATVPLFGAVTGVVWLGERLAAGRVLGLLTGFAGVLVLAWPRLSVGGDRLAVLAALAATVLYALSAHYTRRNLAGVAPLAVSTGSQIAATVLAAPLGVAMWPAVAPSPLAWASAVALGIGCTALAYLLYFRLIARTGAVTALAVTYLIPVFGVTWGAMFLGERLPGSAFAGATLVLAGVALTTRATTPAPRPR